MDWDDAKGLEISVRFYAWAFIKVVGVPAPLERLLGPDCMRVGSRGLWGLHLGPTLI